jgi:hypothetical protein
MLRSPILALERVVAVHSTVSPMGTYVGPDNGIF